MKALLVYSGNLWLNQSFVISSSSFMDRKSCMRREGRMPVAAQRRLESRKWGRGGEWVMSFSG